jgi:hypothetical protein
MVPKCITALILQHESTSKSRIFGKGPIIGYLMILSGCLVLELLRDSHLNLST